MFGPRMTRVEFLLARVLRDPANAKAGAACIAGVICAAMIMHFPEQSGFTGKPRAAATEGRGHDVVTQKVSDCAMANWPYVDERCSGKLDNTRKVRVIATDSKAPATIRSKAPELPAATSQQAAVQTSTQPAQNAPKRDETPAAALTPVQQIPSPPPQPGETPPQPRETQQASVAPDAPAQAELPPLHGRAARLERRRERAERRRAMREAVHMNNGTVVEEKTYRLSDGHVVTVRRTYRADSREALQAQRSQEELPDDENANVDRSHAEDVGAGAAEPPPPEFRRLY
ncbi:MAG TPA: hypothetical protein VFB45_17975 [Pseudolabrys sp.]|nr:hypothetical protein [Pseudolabrys sp.]